MLPQWDFLNLHCSLGISADLFILVMNPLWIRVEHAIGSRHCGIVIFWGTVNLRNRLNLTIAKVWLTYASELFTLVFLHLNWEGIQLHRWSDARYELLPGSWYEWVFAAFYFQCIEILQHQIASLSLAHFCALHKLCIEFEVLFAFVYNSEE